MRLSDRSEMLCLCLHYTANEEFKNTTSNTTNLIKSRFKWQPESAHATRTHHNLTDSNMLKLKCLILIATTSLFLQVTLFSPVARASSQLAPSIFTDQVYSSNISTIDLLHQRLFPHNGNNENNNEPQEGTFQRPLEAVMAKFVKLRNINSKSNQSRISKLIPAPSGAFNAQKSNLHHYSTHLQHLNGTHLIPFKPLASNSGAELQTLTPLNKLIGSPSYHHQQHQHQQQSNQHKKSGQLPDKICIGTSNLITGAGHNKTDHYQNLAERYRNCTSVIGNLEISWLDKGADENPIDLSFLESIREITGYLLIAHVEVDKIRMPNLQIIRGRDLFKLSTEQKEEFALILIENELNSLELPNLREILAGSVGSYNNRNLCHIRTINWDEILNWPMYGSVFVYNGTEPECPACDITCQGSCWAEGPEMCQKFSKTNCSPQCNQGRCFGSMADQCCHAFCAGGCTGPKQTECFACKNFHDDDGCIQECPSMMRYNPSKFLWEANPSGKYAFGATCVKECPEHLLRDNGACVRTCPPNKRSVNGECVPCGGPCPKNCQGVEVVHSGNIDQLINCTVIEGSITILDSSFTGYAEISTTTPSSSSSSSSNNNNNNNNASLGTKFKPMHPSRLDVFKTIREITGYLNIQANHSDFKNLSCFKNLQVIGGRQTTDMFYSLSIIRTSLVELNLHSLRKVRSGRILIEENRDLCFADTIDWLQINITRREDITTRNNAESSKCRALNLQCHEQCAKDGCWGPGPDECLSCNNYKLDDYCVDNCTSTIQANGILSYDSGGRTCKKCHPECRDGCNGIEARHCWNCKSVKDGPYCVSECPSHKYNNNGSCEECDKSCVDGCTGPSNKLGEGGCNSCGKAIINSTDPVFVGHCIRAEEACPEGYYQEYVGPQAEGPLKSSSGKAVCRKCHHMCKSCSGVGTHRLVCECAKYVAGEQCVDYCPRDYFADEQQKQCIQCSPECNGCFGPTEADCITCRVYRIYYESAYTNPMASAHVSNGRIVSTETTTSFDTTTTTTTATKSQQIKFNCTAQCPSSKPHRISESNMLDPYCSEDPGMDPENPRVASTGSIPIILIVIISAAIMVCTSIYKCQIEKDKTVKLTMHLSGIDDVEPLTPSNLKPNLAPLRSIKETELRKGNVLGSGFGGTVYQGLWYPEVQEHKNQRAIPVAIKVLRDNGQSNMNKEFLDEAFIMASVNHPNLVRLLAVCTTPNHQMLVTQLMPLGCLLGYVKKNKNKIGSKNLLEWCKQIANGMAYLENNRMVHRDLALRNVLLQRPGQCKISDFGLAKFLEVNQSEYHSGGGRLPIKWLAPECIRERKFTHKSDVWAFGVTVWELLTFGMRPFEEYATTDVPMAIEKGARLQQPSYVSAEVYKVMYSCWFYDPQDRPNFKGLAQNFADFARDPARYISGKKVKQDYALRGHDLSMLEIADCEKGDYDSDANSMTEVESQPPLSTMPDLTPTTHNRLNEARFGFEHNLVSESEHHHVQNSHIVQTPTSKKTGSMFHGSRQHLFDNNDVFSGSDPQKASSQHLSIKGSTGAIVLTDANNNNFVATSDNNNNNHATTNKNSNRCWSTHHTVSTNSIGQKAELPTDAYDYLLPSQCTNDHSNFSTFYSGSYDSKLIPITPTGNEALSSLRNPPHSAGLLGVNNEEYFMTRSNYVNQHNHQSAGLEEMLSRSQSELSSSSGEIPHSLV